VIVAVGVDVGVDVAVVGVVVGLLWTLPCWLVKRQPENRTVFTVDILMCTSILQIELCHLYFLPHNIFV
jgi:hypothetical protein